MQTVVVAVALVVLGCVQGQLRPLVHHNAHNTFTLHHSTLHLAHDNGEAHVDWGLTVPEGVEGQPCGEGDACLDYGVAKVVVSSEDHCRRVTWTTTSLTELKDCVLIQGHWYGGGEQVSQPWPLESVPRPETAFVTADMLQKRARWYGGVSEAYWVSSQGVALRVEEHVPLFLSVPDGDGDGVADALCLSARHEHPFAAPQDTTLSLEYSLCTAQDVRQVHEATYPKFFSLPDAVPDTLMLQEPIWSTWVQYKTHVNDSRVLDFAREIKEHGFNNSQVEIDDNWETCYGDAIFDPEKFPDPKQMVDDLKGEGYRVTLWVHPFINDDCPAFTLADAQGYLVKDSAGVTQLTHWWQGRSAGIVDFTNTAAAEWWAARLHKLRDDTGLDSFKFDAGESTWLPEVFSLGTDEKYWPNIYTLKYVETAAQFGPAIEVRVGRGSQRHPIFVRMLDKDSTWLNNNGLRSMVPSLLHSGLLGYPFVLPDMVGGNAYGFEADAELFIRWAQANTFMPAIQFSTLPWNYDDPKVTEVSRQVTALHRQFAPLIESLAQQATAAPTPIARPTWWLCPDLEDCLTADQQFLLGDDVLVSPVVHAGATSLRVVVPPGSWRQAGTDHLYTGPATVNITDITLDSNVYFTREQ